MTHGTPTRTMLVPTVVSMYYMAKNDRLIWGFLQSPTELFPQVAGCLGSKQKWAQMIHIQSLKQYHKQ